MGLKIEIQRQLDKKIRKSRLPRKILERFMDSFSIIAETEKTNAFDIKRLQTEKGVFFRLQIGSYRSIFRISEKAEELADIDFIENNDHIGSDDTIPINSVADYMKSL